MRICLSCHSHLWKIHSHSTRVRLSGSPTSEVQESACETRLSQTALLCMINKTFPTPMLFAICSNKNGLCLDINMKHTDALVATVFNLSRRADQQKPSLHWSVLVLELTFIWLWSWRWATVCYDFCIAQRLSFPTFNGSHRFHLDAQTESSVAQI